ncbi:MAG TPA: ArgE/DapE family deacylase [Candidatus Limnocylindria bacterium]|nr:ArgE/DapE family deacylase [Candidatus Limnocylindria bacterium]
MTAPAGSARADLGSALDASRERALDRLQRLVRAQAVAGNEAGAQAIVADAFRAMGARVDTFDVDPDDLARYPGWASTDADYRGRPNVVGVLRGMGDGRSLILNAHVDSVVPGPAELWERDPWSAEISHGRLHGRGAWDDKAGIAIMLWIADALCESGIQMRGDLILESVIDEESSGNGTLACSARGYRADAAIVVDGRVGRAVTAHCGQLWFRITVHGRSAAAVRSRTGVNAIELLLPFVTELRKLEREVPLPPPPFDQLGDAFQLNPGVIAGGATPTTVPAITSLDCHMTFAPPLSLDDAKALVARAVERVTRGSDWLVRNPADLQFLSLQVPPFVAPAGTAELVAALDRSQRAALGTPLEVGPIAGFGDLRHFQLAGPTPCCLYGSGIGENPHAPNEWLELASMDHAAHTLASFVVEWCGRGQ